MNSNENGGRDDRSQEERAKEFARILEQQKQSASRNGAEKRTRSTERIHARRRMAGAGASHTGSRGRKAKQSKKKKLIRRIIITLVILASIVVIGIFLAKAVIRYFAGKLTYEDAASVSTLAPDATLDDDEEGVESTEEPITDSPSEEVAELQSQIDVILRRETTEEPEETFGGKPKETEEPTVAPELEKDGIVNILLLGIDARGHLNGRADAIIVLTINEKQKKIYMTSIMRDVYVAIPGRGGDRINSSYAFGGAPLLLETIEANFGVHIDYYARVDFSSFIFGVDAVGGVDITITEEERHWINEYLNEINGLYGREAYVDKLEEDQVGPLHLNGCQALAYARIRYVGSDYARTQRQRNVINAAVKQLKHQSIPGIIDSLNQILPLITTNIPADMIADLAWSAPAFFKYDIVEKRIPDGGTGKSVTIDKKQVISVDFDINSKLIQDIVSGTYEE
ncbi:MAG: LCP family protein [Lachnospiraceae bacterium]|nr:LCP family protein [Lachnospiraceae bacterium]